MILSTVNFVNSNNNRNSNHRFSDFIISKIKEEQDAFIRPKDNSHRGSDYEKSDLVGPERLPSSHHTDESSCHTTEEVSKKTIGENSSSCVCVCIQTPDGYYLTVDQSNMQICLRRYSEPVLDSAFHKLTFECVEKPSDKATLAVFKVASNPDYYLATTHELHLELQSYCADSLDPERPDERFFFIHELDCGIVFLQPYAQKGYYIHHLDALVSVRRLEINLRPPEEFFFHMKELDLPVMEQERPIVTEDPPVIRPNEEIKLPTRKKSKKVKEIKGSPITPKSFFAFGCFAYPRKSKQKKTTSVNR
ncbi:hypothetical protein CHS0354_021415 [Potamilus streckersoni]|uniref:Uncharacterized protein n=1 Tax=Potamilus streckersoni TaxID=2493646 RepID=A0AAE0S1K2_9BIVA|nr:hypothetical protein CHS0354_021415 [Potamilus streckersoni]